MSERNSWRETVRCIYDTLHFGADNAFTEGDNRRLASRLIALIEQRHPDFFTEPLDRPEGDAS